MVNLRKNLSNLLFTMGLLILSIFGSGKAMAQLQCTNPLAAVLQSGPTGTLTLAAPTPTPDAAFVRTTPANLVLNGDFENFANLALLQGPFSATLADPSAIPGPGSTNPQESWARNTTTVPNWTVGGGNANTYTWHGRNSVLLGTPKSAAAGVGAAGGYIYLGVSAQDLLVGGAAYTAPYPASPEGRITPAGPVSIKIPNTALQSNQSGGPAFIQQTVNLIVGRQYRMTYYVAAENLLNGSPYSSVNGIMGLDISGYAREYLTVHGHSSPLTNSGVNGLYYTLEFTAKQAATTIGFVNFGHATTVVGSGNSVAAESTIDDVIINACTLQYRVSGNIFNDINGLSDSLVNGTGTNAASLAMTVYLVNSANQVVNYATVSPDGTYYFANVAPATDYTVVLSNNAGTAASVGIAPPPASLPAGWVNTGENNAAPAVVGNDGLVNGVSAPFAVSTTDIANINFGVEQPPVAGTATYTTRPNPGGTVAVAVDVGAFVGLLPASIIGSNATDANTVTNIKITAFPINASAITINSVVYTAGTFAAGGITLKLDQLPGIVVDPSDGAITVTIPYVAIDAAGQQSAAGAVVLPFGGGTANLAVTKTNATTTLVAGSTTSYTVTFSNAGPSVGDGTVIKDVPSSGLICTVISYCTSTGGASCPASLPAAFTSLFSADGLTIINFPANSTISLVILCNVSATGNEAVFPDGG
jgi:uncharacterized repeat protein (TIGR01451 family)